ncbi:MAG: efflux RND transporter periplasmic adaptor subunit [Marinifilaceae bacterium]
MKRLLIAGIIPLLFACSAKDANQSEDKEAQLKAYKKEMVALKKKIATLEKEVKSSQPDQNIIPVKIQTLENSRFEHYIQITGNVEADKNIRISPEASGNIVSIDVVEGQKVKKGCVLGRLNTSQIQRNIDEVKINLKLSTTMFERQKNLWNQKIGSEIQYLEAKSSKEALEQKLEALEAQLDMAVIRAPFNGIVDEIFQKKGELATPQTPFAQLVNINKVYVEGDVSESFLTQIKAGAPAQLDFPAINFQTEAPIYRTSNVIDPGNRSFKIRINLNNPQHLIKPNLISLVKIRDFAQEDALVVPSIIIKQDFKGQYLYVAKKENNHTVARKVYVKVSKTYNNQSMIAEGLSLGDSIITEGYTQVVNGTEVSIN